MNTFKLIFCSLGISLLLQISFCSLPSDIEPVKWNMKVELPVTDKHFLARDLLPDDIASGLNLDLGDTSGDTAALKKTDSLRYVIEKELVSLDTSILEKELGARSLDNTPLVDVFFGLMENSNLPGEQIRLPSNLLLNSTHDEQLNGIRSITFDESSTPLQINVKNSSQSADMKNVNVFLIDKGDTLGKIGPKVIPASSSITVPFSMGGKTIHSPITIAVAALVDSGSLVTRNDGLRISFSMDGLETKEAELADSMIDYSDVFTGEFGITDSINVEAIDLDDALLRCEVINPSNLKIGLTGLVEDAWKYNFAKTHDLQKIENLKKLNAKDSADGFAGALIHDTLFKAPGISSQAIMMHLNNMRLFPTWDVDSGKSVLKYRYTVHSLSDGRVIRFKKDDKFIFKLIPDRFPFIQIKGKFIKPIEQSFSSRQKIGFDWSGSIIDSLRKSFRFKSAQIQLDLIPDLPRNSSLDSLLMHLVLREQKNNDSVEINEMIKGVYPDSLHSTNAFFTNILNDWPDSIGFDAQVKVPAGTNINLYNTKDQFGKYKSTLSIGLAVKYTVKIPFCWKVRDTIRTELDQSSFSLDRDNLEKVKKLQNTFIQVNMSAINNTNLNVLLFAIGADEMYKDELMDIPSSLIGTDKLEGALGNHVFSLFGNEGISLAKRGKQSVATAKLDQRGIDALVSNDKCLVRWVLCIPAGDFDAFTNKDYLDLKASAVIKAVGNSDSLLYEDK